MGGKVKRGNGNNRGYIGHHTTWDGKYVFLRSKAEFIYARKLDYDRTPYLLEVLTYEVNGVKYKPDFFIYDSSYSDIKAIVEVKGLDDKTTALSYFKSYKKYFDMLGIDYSVVWKQMSTIKKYSLENDIIEWVKKSIEQYDNISDVSGENNPMYNNKHSDKTKKLIGDKVKERCSDSEYTKMLSNAQKVYWNSIDGLAMRKQISVKRKNHAKKSNPIIISSCNNCGDNFNKNQNNKNEFCSCKCKKNWLRKNVENYGKHTKTTSYQNQLKTYIDKIISTYGISFDVYIMNIETITKQAKLDKIIPKNKGISLKTLIKFKII